jgi:hypothetical protein
LEPAATVPDVAVALGVIVCITIAEPAPVPATLDKTGDVPPACTVPKVPAEYSFIGLIYLFKISIK